MENKKHDPGWRSILLLVFSLSGAVLAFSTATGILATYILSRNAISQLAPANTSHITTILLSSTLIAIGTLLLPAGWLSLQRLRGREFNSIYLGIPKPLTWILVPVIWGLVLILGTLFYDAPGANVYLPFLHFLSVALPVYLLIRVGVSRTRLGSSQRVWAVFGSGLALSPLLAFIVELILLIVGIVIVAIYLSVNPEKMFAFERLIKQIEQAPNMDSLVFLLSPYLKNSLTLIAALSFLALFVPVVEELVKSVGVWLVFDRLQTKAQGFALGFLSGAGFALAESLAVSLTPDDGWALTFATRSISSIMHMLASGIVGWGIAYARLEKQYLRTVAMIIIAMLLHGIWNAGVIFAVLGGVRVLLNMPDLDLIGSTAMMAGAGLIFTLIPAMFIGLVVLKRRLQEPLRSDIKLGVG